MRIKAVPTILLFYLLTFSGCLTTTPKYMLYNSLEEVPLLGEIDYYIYQYDTPIFEEELDWTITSYVINKYREKKIGLIHDQYNALDLPRMLMSNSDFFDDISVDIHTNGRKKPASFENEIIKKHQKGAFVMLYAKVYPELQQLFLFVTIRHTIGKEREAIFSARIYAFGNENSTEEFLGLFEKNTLLLKTTIERMLEIVDEWFFIASDRSRVLEVEPHSTFSAPYFSWDITHSGALSELQNHINHKEVAGVDSVISKSGAYRGIRAVLEKPIE